MNRYLICSADESVARRLPTSALANSADEAMDKYLRTVYSKDEIFLF